MSGNELVHHFRPAEHIAAIPTLWRACVWHRISEEKGEANGAFGSAWEKPALSLTSSGCTRGRRE
jgi:hypothetical protein